MTAKPTVIRGPKDLADFDALVMPLEQWCRDPLAHALRGAAVADVAQAIGCDGATAAAAIVGALHVQPTIDGGWYDPLPFLSPELREARDLFARMLTARSAGALFPSEAPQPPVIDWGHANSFDVSTIKARLRGETPSWGALPEGSRVNAALSVAHVSLESWRQALGVDTETMTRWLVGTKSDIVQAGDVGTPGFDDFLRSFAFLRSSHKDDWNNAKDRDRQPQYIGNEVVVQQGRNRSKALAR